MLLFFIEKRPTTNRVHSPVWGKGNLLLHVEIYFHIRKFIPRSGGGRVKGPFFGMFVKKDL